MKAISLLNNKLIKLNTMKEEEIPVIDENAPITSDPIISDNDIEEKEIDLKDIPF